MRSGWKTLAAGTAVAALIAGCAGITAALTAGESVQSDPEPTAATAQPAISSTVRWVDGPWPPTVLAGQPLRIPESSSDGPLRDRGEWASDYLPTPLGAAVAALRCGPLVLTAPPSRRGDVMTASMTADHIEQYLARYPLNDGPEWSVPEDVLVAAAATPAAVLGAVGRVDDSGLAPTAEVEVFTLTGDATAATPRLARTTYRLIYQDRQWLMETPQPGDTVAVNAPPPRYTVAVPQVSGGGE